MRYLPLLAALGLIACTPSSEPADTAAGGTTESGSEAEGSGTETGTDTGNESQGETSDVPDCTPGAFGCTCAEGDVCSPDLECVDGMCNYSSCSPGTNGCPCSDAGCHEGLFCIEDTCKDCLPGSLGCDCDAGSCESDLSCIEGACWLPSPYPNCGWVEAGYYFCAAPVTFATPDFPIECPADLVADMPCPPELTYEGCCDDTGTWWCENSVVKYMACG